MTTTDSGRPGRRALLRLRRVSIPLLLLLLAAPAAALDTIWLVRHAEKTDAWLPNPELDAFHPLSPAGETRAESLAAKLKDAGIATIYTSRTTRTIATGAPLARGLGIPVVADDATTKPDELMPVLEKIFQKHAGDRAILIVGHSNTIPLLLEKLGAQPDCYERLGIQQTPQGLLIEGYEGLWKVDAKKLACEGITRE